jgi:hypothetical protein
MLARIDVTRSLAAGLLLALIASPGCAPDGAADQSEGTSQDALLGAEEESFSTYDATPEELASAAPGPSSAQFDNELVLYAVPAPKLIGLSWKRPGGLARRTLVNNALELPRSLGHAMVRVQCGASAGLPAEHFQGSVYATGNEFRDMVLKEKAGLGVLLRSVPGTLETEDEERETIDQRYENGRISFVRFGISKEVCRGLLGYSKAFQEKNIAAQYGFVRPLYKEGAGCSAFSMAFLELANLVEPRFIGAWTFDVRIPMTLIGGKDNPGNKVTVLELFTTFRSWAAPDEPHQRLVGWDPTKMFTTIRTWSKAAIKNHNETVERRGKALGLVLDRRTVVPRSELTKATYWAGEPGAPRDYWGFGDP